MSNELRKLERAYDKAEGKLRALRDKLYPIGMKGTDKIHGCGLVIIPGSLYADRINTNMGHMTWRTFEPVKEKL